METAPAPHGNQETTVFSVAVSPIAVAANGLRSLYHDARGFLTGERLRRQETALAEISNGSAFYDSLRQELGEVLHSPDPARQALEGSSHPHAPATKRALDLSAGHQDKITQAAVARIQRDKGEISHEGTVFSIIKERETAASTLPPLDIEPPASRGEKRDAKKFVKQVEVVRLKRKSLTKARKIFGPDTTVQFDNSRKVASRAKRRLKKEYEEGQISAEELHHGIEGIKERPKYDEGAVPANVQRFGHRRRARSFGELRRNRTEKKTLEQDLHDSYARGDIDTFTLEAGLSALDRKPVIVTPHEIHKQEKRLARAERKLSRIVTKGDNTDQIRRLEEKIDDSYDRLDDRHIKLVRAEVGGRTAQAKTSEVVNAWRGETERELGERELFYDDLGRVLERDADGRDEKMTRTLKGMRSGRIRDAATRWRAGRQKKMLDYFGGTGDADKAKEHKRIMEERGKSYRDSNFSVRERRRSNAEKLRNQQARQEQRYRNLAQAKRQLADLESRRPS